MARRMILFELQIARASNAKTWDREREKVEQDHARRLQHYCVKGTDMDNSAKKIGRIWDSASEYDRVRRQRRHLPAVRVASSPLDWGADLGCGRAMHCVGSTVRNIGSGQSAGVRGSPYRVSSCKNAKSAAAHRAQLQVRSQLVRGKIRIRGQQSPLDCVQGRATRNRNRLTRRKRHDVRGAASNRTMPPPPPR